MSCFIGRAHRTAELLAWQAFCTYAGMTIRQTDWRKLCEMVMNESDPTRFSELVDQLLVVLDERRQELHGKKSLIPAHKNRAEN